MSEPKIARKGPYIKDETAGKKVAWCSCGYSDNQPYCDGSHKGTGYPPMVVTIEKEGNVAWCGCKRSDNKPYCDGTHGSL